MGKLQVYRIILPTDRYVNQQFSIHKQCIDSISIKEIDYKKLLNADLPIDTNFHQETYGFPLSHSEIANFIQHREIWKMFLDSSEPYCLIVESNVSANLSVSDILLTINDLPSDWDLFFPYDTFQYIKKLNGAGLKLLNPNTKEIRSREPYLLRQKWGNSIYFLSKSGAQKLLEIDSIKDRLDNEIVQMSLLDKINLFIAEVEWFHYRQIDWKEWLDRNKNIWDAILALSPWTHERKIRIRGLLSLISIIGQKLKIKLVLQAGTHLGYIQHGGIMPWDDDTDIGIEEMHIDFFIKEIAKYEHIVIREVLEGWTNTKYYKIWDKRGENIEGHDHTFPFVDLWLYQENGNDLVFKNGIICPNSAKYPLEKVEFEGSTFFIPANSIEVLDSRYTSWKRKIIVYSWSHRLEKPHFPHYSVPILTDEKGRMISIQ